MYKPKLLCTYNFPFNQVKSSLAQCFKNRLPFLTLCFRNPCLLPRHFIPFSPLYVLKCSLFYAFTIIFSFSTIFHIPVFL